MRYIFVRQHETTDCAAACLAMICLYYGKDTTITKLRDMMGTDLKGTNLLGLANCADELGFATQAVKVDKEAFLSKFTLPAIANIITKEGLSHYVVLFKISKKYIVLGDPAKDLIKMKFEDFYKSFTGTLLILKPNDGFEKNKIKGNSMFVRYLKLLLPQKKLFCYAVLASFLLTILGVISSIFNNVIYDEILPYNQKDTLRMLVFIFLGVSVVQIVLNFFRQWMMMLLSIRIDIPLTLGYFEHVYKLPMKFFSTRKTGDITTRFSDAFVIKDVFTSIALTLIMDIGMTIVSGIILFQMNTKLFSILLFMIIVSVLLVLIFKLPYKKINEQQMQQSSILNSQIIEGLRSIETIKANANEESELENLEREYIKSLRISYKEGMLSNIQGTISNSISVLGNVLLTYIGIMQVLEGTNTLGNIMAFMTLTNYFMDPVSRLVSLQLSIQEANISMKRISEIMDYNIEQDVKQSRFVNEYMGINESIEFKSVKFRYGIMVS